MPWVVCVRKDYVAVGEDEDSPDETVFKVPVRICCGSYRGNLFRDLTRQLSERCSLVVHPTSV